MSKLTDSKNSYYTNKTNSIRSVLNHSQKSKRNFNPLTQLSNLDINSENLKPFDNNALKGKNKKLKC